MRNRLSFTIGLLLAVTVPLQAQEATLGEEPAPASVQELSGSFALAFEKGIGAKILFPRLKGLQEVQDPFWRDMNAAYQARTYYFHREKSDGSKAEAWAVGGVVDAQSGIYREAFSTGVGYYFSERLVGESDRDGTLLLAPGQEDFGVLGKAYGRFHHGKQKLTLYRQELNLPYVNRQDNRMGPNTFEAYMADGRVTAVPGVGSVSYVLGYVDEIKKRNAENFTSMSRAANASGGDRGLVMTGLAIEPTDDFLLGAINHYVDDTLNIFYTEADWKGALTDELDVRTQLQFTHQQSLGEGLLGDGSFDTWALSGRASASLRGVLLKAAFSTTDRGAAIRAPYGSYPGYISLMQKDFNRADEDAWLLGASYNFEDVGLNGLSMFLNYAEGINASDEEGGLPDQREFNITADWNPEKGLFKNLWLRVRWSTLDIAGEDQNLEDFRVILNYEIAIL